VATNAVNWANRCVYCHSASYSDTPQSGENIAEGFASLFDVTQAWYSEINGFTNNGGEGTCTCNECGHYTAMMWSTTSALGCGTCPASDYFAVCQYALEAPNININTETTTHVSLNNTPVNTEAYCCSQIFGPSPPTPPTPPTAAGSSPTPACPQSSIAAVFSSCDSTDLSICIQSSGCGQAASTLDLTFSALSMTGSQEAGCVNQFIQSLPAGQQPASAVSNLVLTRLNANQQVCSDYLGAGVSNVPAWCAVLLLPLLFG